MKLSVLYKLAALMPVLIFTIPEAAYCAESEKIILCPAKIVCSRDKSVSSCTASGGDLEYWGSISDYPSPVKKGKYAFSGVDEAYYQSPYYRGVYGCKYNQNDLEHRVLFISGKSLNMDLEAFPGVSTNWEVNGYNANCHATDPTLCPFAEVPLIKVSMDIDNYAQLDIYANGIPVTKFSLPTQKEPYVITMYQAWDACSDNGLCLLHLMIKEGAGTSDIGSILVDMSDKMKIQFIYPSCGIGYTISSKSETPNLIEIKGL